MKEIYEKCADVFLWFIDNKKNSMPEKTFEEICGEDKDEVLKELKENANVFLTNKKTVWSVKQAVAEHYFMVYANKAENSST